MTHYTRREFIKTGIVAGTAAVYGTAAFPRAGLAAASPELAVVSGGDAYTNALRAVDALGGMGKFVSKGSKVGLLVNSPFGNPGTHTDPDVALAVLKGCWDAGAKSVISLKSEPAGYWDGGTKAASLKDAVAALTPCSDDYVTHTLSGTRSLKEADVIRELFEVDVFINVSIAKHHTGTNFSCILKNMMGALPHHTCRFFHMGTGKAGWYGDLDHMSRCIAEINSVRRPDLSIADATRFITSNGPFGPGNLVTGNTVVAGVDPLLTDAYCSRYLDLKPDEVGMIREAAAMGLGKADPARAAVLELEI